jgi:hypothetical protein
MVTFQQARLLFQNIDERDLAKFVFDLLDRIAPANLRDPLPFGMTSRTMWRGNFAVKGN